MSKCDWRVFFVELPWLLFSLLWLVGKIQDIRFENKWKNKQ